MFIQRSHVEQLIRDMLKHREKAVESSEYAKELTQAYAEKFASGKSRFVTRVDAERSAANDARWIGAVEDNKMYDRFATRDAAVLSALLAAESSGLLNIRDE
jgi:hypothetical protein